MDSIDRILDVLVWFIIHYKDYIDFYGDKVYNINIGEEVLLVDKVMDEKSYHFMVVKQNSKVDRIDLVYDNDISSFSCYTNFYDINHLYWLDKQVRQKGL